MNSLLVGMVVTEIAFESGRGDPYQMVRCFETAAGVLILGIAVIAFTTHRGIQALSRFRAEQMSDPTS